ncbi:hypothetical protein LEP1GSC127_1420 [Leptospira kirschneri str. 200801925]|nr:hypothetical protein LEP1GSC127_1420 [Leptospira kirschneri str. 200801925]
MISTNGSSGKKPSKRKKRYNPNTELLCEVSLWTTTQI